MSYDALGLSDAMLDSLSLQLREAEVRRVEAERAHQEALAQLRGVTSASAAGRGCGEPLETLQSRARELEKKAALETVRCEELQLELSAALKSRNSRPMTTTAPATSSGINSTVTWAPMATSQGSEIDKIMAKIEQARLSIANDNRILAELEHPRTTGPTLPSSSMLTSGLTGMTSSTLGVMPSSVMTSIGAAGGFMGLSGTSGLGGTTGMTGTCGLTGTSGLVGYAGIPGMSSMTGYSGASGITAGGMGNVTGAGVGMAGISGIGTNSIGITSSISSHAITSIDTSAFTGGGTATAADKMMSGIGGIHVSPLPGRAHPMTSIPPLSQSTTMPVLSLHNSYNLPSGSASYSLGLSGAPVMPSYTHPSMSGGSVLGSVLGTGLTGTSTAATSMFPPAGALPASVLTSALPHSYGVGGTSYTTYSNPLLTAKLKPLDEIDLGVGRFTNRASSPCSPIPPPSSWGLDGYNDAMNPSYMPRSLGLGGLDLETRTHGYPLNGTGEPQVDMLDIPGKGRCCVFIARFSYDPPEESEGELSLCAGDYLLVWGNGEPQSGYYDAELLDGRRGLVPASFVQRLIGDDLLEFHQAVLSTLRDADDLPLDPAPLPPLQPNNPLLTHTSEDMARLSETQTDLGPDQSEDDADTVPAPKHLTLERQLNKSVLIGWTPAEPPGFNNIESYHVYVDGVLKVTVKANERTRALVEGVDSNRPHRISVRSVTQNRRTSRDAACTMIIGRDTAHLGPSAVRATNITCSSAVISWLPANSNHQHVVCVNNVEVRTVKPGVYRHTITGLAPSTQYRVTVRAKHLRAPGQAPPPGPPPEEAPGAYTDFRTLAKGLPDPPQDIQVEAGPQDGTLLVTWQPVNRPPSSGPVTGYAVYADGKKVTDVDSPTGDHALIDIGKLVGLNPRAVTVRTKSRDSQSSDSAPTPIPNVVRNAARTRHNVAHATLQGHMRVQQRSAQMAPNQMQGGSMQGPGQISMGAQLQGQQQQMSGPMQGQLPGQMQGQMPGQMAGQMTGQMSGQMPGQMTSQMQGQMPGQMQGQMQGPMQGQLSMSSQQQQQIIEHEENLSDKEVFPNQMLQQQMVNNQARNGSVGSIPAIEITKDGSGPPDECQFEGDELEFASMNRRRNAPSISAQQQQTHHHPQQQQQQQGYQPNAAPRSINDRARQTNPANPNQPYYGPGGPPQQTRNPNQRSTVQQRGPLTQQQQQQKKPRYFVAMFDYDPSTMSPNPDGCEEELPFQEGDTIKVYGDKDPDGFYWGELRGRRGYVPHNMVSEIDEAGAQGGSSGTTQQSVRGLSRDRWGDIYANMPVKRMIALYDYDPQELSPNVDAEQVELSFKTGEVILVYGDMDEDGFYMGELDGVRGLVPSNFLAEAPEQYNNQMGPGGPQAAQRNPNNRNRPQGPGARGPAPPTTSTLMTGAMNQRGQTRKDARPTSPTLLDNTGHPAPDHQTQGMQGKGGMIGRAIGIGGNMGIQQQQQQQQQQHTQSGMMQQGPMQSGLVQQGMMQQGLMQQGMTQQGMMQQGMQHQQQQQQPPHLQQQTQQQMPPTTTQQQSSGGLLSGATSLFSGATQAASSGLFGTKQPPKGVPQVVPQPGLQPMSQQQQTGGGGLFGGGQQHQPQQQNQQQQQPGQGPNLMQKINEMAAPGGDILSKGKELIFMKFGLGGK